jgi:hypothetical protein
MWKKLVEWLVAIAVVLTVASCIFGGAVPFSSDPLGVGRGLGG